MEKIKQQYEVGGREGSAPHFKALLGFERLESPEGSAIVELKLRQEHCNFKGTVHGGVVMTLIDVAGYWAGVKKDVSEHIASTVSMNCSFLRGTGLAQTTSLRAEAQITKRGRSMYFSTIKVYACPGGEMLASGQGVFSVAQPR
ncbi:PaaI family thioesterase [Noviherbaspirillum sp. Root189]|uniref:PaaI family thioesterase n=1 Tax=Noviherbaspirillum sp. Root189 TaxID=1736487 RepID=UPI000713CA28|nr:PaaI family thioesterase [Noviherbaspirillum sp. Root189]KRB81572.1 hypothetical protein ASE07_24465 [Noviherbaspirillum sp. Root189]